MARIPEEIIRSVQDSVDIVDVVSRFVTLKRTGRSFKGLCPFHEEKTPSFHVFPESGRFKCFGCGEGGDVFAFLMSRSGLAFREALEELAREAGVSLPDEGNDAEASDNTRQRGEALDALEFAERFYRIVLSRDAGREARAYLADRDFQDETLEAFGVGFAPDDYEALIGYATGKGISTESLEHAGLIRRNERGRHYDMFRGRIMFPIRDLRGRVIGFGARALGDAQPKYLNSPDGTLFHKGREMYGLHLAREASRTAGRLLVVEGYTDVMHCHQSGLREVAAGLGTALTQDNARQMRRFGVPVHLVYDGDEAGRRAAERAAEVLLEEQVEGAVVLLPVGRDPADLMREEGPEALESALEGEKDLWSYRMERAFERNPGKGLEARERVANELSEVVRRIGDPVRRDLAVKLLHERTGVRELILRNQIASKRPAMFRKDSTTPPARQAWVRAEQDLICAALEDIGTWDRAARIYPPDSYQDADLREVARAISDLRGHGESVTREALLGVLSEKDQVVRVLQSLEPAEDALERAEQHLDHLAGKLRLDHALAQSDLEAVVKARTNSSAETTDGL